MGSLHDSDYGHIAWRIWSMMALLAKSAFAAVTRWKSPLCVVGMLCMLWPNVLRTVCLTSAWRGVPQVQATVSRHLLAAICVIANPDGVKDSNK